MLPGEHREESTVLPGLGAEVAEVRGLPAEDPPEAPAGSEQERSSERPQCEACEPPRLQLPDMSSHICSDLPHCTAHIKEST